MEKDFNLSEKIIQKANGHNFVEDTNIKEFIKRLKEEIERVRPHDCNGFDRAIILNLIDKLAGEKFA